MKILFVSDVHLKEHKSPEYINFLSFLNFVLNKKNIDHLFLVGDIFDFWLSDKNIFYNYFSDVVNLLIKIANQGTKIYYFEGNHDIYLKDFFKDKTNINIYNSPQFFCIDGLKLKVEHGDLINKEDYWYFKWKIFLHSKFIKTFIKLSPGFFLLYLSIFCGFLSKFNRKIKSNKKNILDKKLYEDKIKLMLRQYAQVDCQNEDADIFVHGHVHVADFYEYQVLDKKKYSINLGEWKKAPKVLSIIDKKIKLSSLSKIELLF